MDEEDLDKRKHPRVRVDIQVGIILSSGKVVYARIKNISVGGIFISTIYSADKGKQFQMFFNLPLHGVAKKIEVICKVAFVHFGKQDEVFIGMEFVKFRDNGKNLVCDYVDDRLS